MNNQTKTRIIVTHGTIARLARDCRCSDKSVTYALRGATSSELADLVRDRALRFYGGVLAGK